MVKPCQTLLFEDQRTQRPAGGKLFARLIEVLVTKWSIGGASWSSWALKNMLQWVGQAIKKNPESGPKMVRLSRLVIDFFGHEYVWILHGPSCFGGCSSQRNIWSPCNCPTKLCSALCSKIYRFENWLPSKNSSFSTGVFKETTQLARGLKVGHMVPLSNSNKNCRLQLRSFQVAIFCL